MRVGVDSDGVIDNFGEGVRATLEARGLGHLWKSGPVKESYWNFYEDWKWDFPRFKALVDWGVDNGYIFTGHWRDGALEAMERLARTGNEIVIVTDRAFGSDPKNSQRNTVEAFAAAGIWYDEIWFTSDKTAADVDIMVEDRLENYDALEAYGVEVYLINRSWNKVEGGDNRRRINSITDFVDIVEAKSVLTDVV